MEKMYILGTFGQLGNKFQRSQKKSLLQICSETTTRKLQMAINLGSHSKLELQSCMNGIKNQLTFTILHSFRQCSQHLSLLKTLQMHTVFSIWETQSQQIIFHQLERLLKILLQQDIFEKFTKHKTKISIHMDQEEVMMKSWQEVHLQTSD